MDQSWRFRPPPPPPHPCPVCSHPHFPFCPPLPFKRPRIDAPDLSTPYGFNQPRPFLPPADDQRRLDLIRDHGLQRNGFDGKRKFSEIEPFGGDRGSFGSERIRVGHKLAESNYGLERSFGGQDHGNFGFQRSHMGQGTGNHGLERSFDGHEHGNFGLDRSPIGQEQKNFGYEHMRFGLEAAQVGFRSDGYDSKSQFLNGYSDQQRYPSTDSFISVRPTLYGNNFQARPAPPGDGSYGHVEFHNARFIEKGSGHLPMGNVGNEVYNGSNYPPLPPHQPPSPPPQPSPPCFQASPFSGDAQINQMPANSSGGLQFRPAFDTPGNSQSYPQPLYNESFAFAPKMPPYVHQRPSTGYIGQGISAPLEQMIVEKPKMIDAFHVFKKPHRTTRPDHIVVILRGLPGSGKSYLAKMLRDVEVENGGSAPRIHSMDDYFMTEVEKVEDADGKKSSASAKGKKQVAKKVMEYCYEPEMEEAYRASMLKAFRKTVEEGTFTFVIVDDRNLRVADFAQFWAIGKSSGYEVYLLEATYNDPTGCAARNLHDFTLEDIQKMVEKWEEAPPLYMRLDVQSLFQGDDLNQQNIMEVDMDTEDAGSDDRGAVLDEKDQNVNNPVEVHTSEESHKENQWVDGEADCVKELGKSKWSENFDEDNDKKINVKNNSSSLSGLIQAYSKSEKSVHWGDQVEKRGFSIGPAKHPSISSLVIGPGSGYNLLSNPLPEEADSYFAGKSANRTKKHLNFEEHLRAERESFQAVFDRRRQRIGGLHDTDDE